MGKKASKMAALRPFFYGVIIIYVMSDLFVSTLLIMNPWRDKHHEQSSKQL